ncbi:thermonuclease family protein [Methylobacterium nonmethylotrophicum]|uniref:TNase-like domain-containing protein n=1 Tax=Methylobacterium nonmethylotrophicum TaxID=1141884 RepID=A0A4Z0NMA4_9HYPH|nr:hypothetical protein [Methylobacterium nonmethylotrophicum]TGD97133.1 hypothetical protein EU555_20425 [Methylobacterium nonmethylotrophicum]
MTSREQLQALIRAVIDRQRPVAVARRTLELLVESATRSLDAPPGYQIVDRDGRPRTRPVGGEAVPLTLSDLADELRRQHPNLFQPAVAPSPPAPSPASSPPHSGPATPSPAAPDPAPAPAEAPRDWIVVKPATRPETPPRPDRAGRLRDTLRGLGARLRRPALAPAAPAAPVLPVQAPAPVPSPPPAGGGLKPGIARRQPLPGRGVPRRPLYAALGALVVLGAGYAALRGERTHEAATVQASGTGTASDAGPKVAEARTADTKPAETRPAEARPAEAKPVPKGQDTKAAEAKPGAKREPGETGALVPEATGPVAGVAEVLDTATLRLGGRTLRLYGVEAAKGAQASDLTGYLGGRPVNCQPSPARTAWICTVDGHDLSEVVLYNGGGRATPEATPDLIEAERHARVGKLGIWAKP